jgi:hypothetical protein
MNYTVVIGLNIEVITLTVLRGCFGFGINDGKVFLNNAVEMTSDDITYIYIYIYIYMFLHSWFRNSGNRL